jgi:16S rRNA processing protein RimM
MGGSSDRLVAIGEVTRPHGLHGELRVTPLTDDPDRFSRLEACVLWDPATDRRDRRRLTAARRHGGAVVLGLAGCDSVEAARSLVGRLVAVPEQEALAPGPGRFYPWQLAGCRVETEDGREVGTVTGIETSPAHDLWVVDAGGRECLVPAVPEIVVDVDLAGRRVVIRPPDGLLDL